MTYFDWAATAIPREDIIFSALKESFNYFGNPSSPHDMGATAKEKVDNCRSEVGKLLNCSKESIYFTSGATESNNIVCFSFLKKHGHGEIISTSIEHPSISQPLEVLKTFGWKIKTVSPKTNGSINLKKLIKSITDKTRLINLIHVHNETGVIQDLDLIIKEIRNKEKEFGRRIFIHIDSVQAAGKIPININSMDIDSLSISGHKFGAPKGIGILYLKSDRDVIYRGGGQEKGIRPGTESVFNIIAITNCLKASIKEHENVSNSLKNKTETIITAVRKIGIDTIPKDRDPQNPNFLPNIISLTAPPIAGEVLVRVLNEKGFYLSTGSACSSNKKSNTKGILSMGITEDEGFSSFRISMGRLTTDDDVNKLLNTLKDTIKELAP